MEVGHASIVPKEIFFVGSPHLKVKNGGHATLEVFRAGFSLLKGVYVASAVT